MENSHAKRHILRSSSIIGVATGGGLLISLIRMKIIAALIGPPGVGLMGLLSTIMTLGFAIAGMGIDSSAVRQLSAAGEDPEKARVARWAIWTYAWPLAIIGSGLCWFLRIPIARLAMGSASYASAVGWISIGIGASVIGAVELAQVQAMRRLGDLARIRLWSALGSALVGVASVYFLGIKGIVAAVLAVPIVTLVSALWFNRSTPKWQTGGFPSSSIVAEWLALAGLGTAVMLSATSGSITQTAVRAVLTHELGLSAAGLFQASFAVSSLNLTVLLGAMVAEYYPRVSAASQSGADLTRILNDQVHVALVLTGPALIGISASSPILLHALYTSEFSGAALLLRLQVAADALRVVGWAVGYVLLAQRRALAYFIVEAALGIVFVPLTWLTAAKFGVSAAGAAYLLGYLFSLTLAAAFARRTGVTLDRRNSVTLVSLVGTLLGVAALSEIGNGPAMIAGCTAFVIASYISLREILRLGFLLNPSSILGRLRRTLGV